MAHSLLKQADLLAQSMRDETDVFMQAVEALQDVSDETFSIEYIREITLGWAQSMRAKVDRFEKLQKAINPEESQ